MRYWCLIGMMVGVQGCVGDPLARTLEEQLAEQMAAQYRVYRNAVKDAPPYTLKRIETDVLGELDPRQQEKVREMSGIESYTREYAPKEDGSRKKLRVSRSLLDTESARVTVTLERAIQFAAENNLDAKQASLGPAISQTQVTQAEARFDAVYFAETGYNVLDTPRPPTAIAAFGSQRTEDFTFRTGIRKTLTTGAQVSVETGFARREQDPSFFATDGGFAFNEADVLVSIDQPLLRGFGSDVNRADIELTENATDQRRQEARQALTEVVLATEQAYWNLVFARMELKIRTRLLELHEKDVEVIRTRRGFDQSPAALAQSLSFQEQARSQVIQSGERVRIASDELKRLVNSDALPLAGEELLVPLDQPIDAPVRFNVADAIRTALLNRPEVQVALMQIKDASIRQRVADNLRLPDLTVGATIRVNGLDVDSMDGAYQNLGEGNFIDYIVRAQFEVPIGNRAANAGFQQAQLERRLAVINYRNVIQQVVLELKTALRELRAAYELIGSARAARLAAAQNFRTFQVRQEAGDVPNEGFMDQKLRSEQRLAEAEVTEISAIIGYNNAVANLYRSMGTLLERNRIILEN